MAWAKSTTTKHTHTMAFGRREANCPRCEELNEGAAPVVWNKAPVSIYVPHHCTPANCGVVCTKDQW